VRSDGVRWGGVGCGKFEELATETLRKRRGEERR
jgi:hypothetical protein